jgi:hypothetical protein
MKMLLTYSVVFYTYLEGAKDWKWIAIMGLIHKVKSTVVLGPLYLNRQHLSYDTSLRTVQIEHFSGYVRF